MVFSALLLALFLGSAQGAKITLYQHGSLGGISKTLTGSVPRFGDIGFNDMLSSARVDSGTWRIYQHYYYGGTYVTLTPGTYSSAAAMGFPNDAASSLKLISEEDKSEGKCVKVEVSDRVSIPDNASRTRTVACPAGYAALRGDCLSSNGGVNGHSEFQSSKLKLGDSEVSIDKTTSMTCTFHNPLPVFNIGTEDTTITARLYCLDVSNVVTSEKKDECASCRVPGWAYRKRTADCGDNEVAVNIGCYETNSKMYLSTQKARRASVVCDGDTVENVLVGYYCSWENRHWGAITATVGSRALCIKSRG